MTARCMLALLAGVVAGAAPAGADVLHLHNGNRVRGVIAREDDAGVTLRIGRKMTMVYPHKEIARVQRESAEVNAGLKAAWRGPERTPEPAEDAAPPPPEPADVSVPAPARSAEQRRREDLIDDLDLDEELTTPDELKATLGPPQVERRGLSRAGQKILDFGYDIGRGLLRIVRFREMRQGYAATDTFDEEVEPADTTKAATPAPREEPTE